MSKFREILTTTNVMILIILASSSLIFGVQAYFHELKRMDCISQAIYHNATEDKFIKCVMDSGLFDVNGINWVFIQFTLTLASILIVAIVDVKKKRKHKAENG